MTRTTTSGPARTRLDRTGFEIELLAPPGSDRRTLAARIASEHGGGVVRGFHLDSEPSLVPGMGHFWHLTPAYRVDDAGGAELVTLVDDVTIVPRPAHPAEPDPLVFRMLSDDVRLLRLVEDTTGQETTFTEVLDGVARVFGVTVETIGPVRRVRDRTGATIAMATGLAPGRERPCELVTPPLDHDHDAALEALLRPARELGFTVPVEAAVHLHLDGGPFRSVPVFANVVRLFGRYRDALYEVLGTNTACTRLGALPDALLDLVDDRSAPPPDWPRLQEEARAVGLTKYADVNLTALLVDAPQRDTVEVRILPGAIEAAEVTRRAGLVRALLGRCLDPTPVPSPPPGCSPVEGLLRLVGDDRVPG